MNITEPKWMLTSRTVWGGILAILAGLIPALGYMLTQGDIQSLNELFDNILAVIAGGLAIWGRFKAKQPITTQANPDVIQVRQRGYAAPWFTVALVILGGLLLFGVSQARADDYRVTLYTDLKLSSIIGHQPDNAGTMPFHGELGIKWAKPGHQIRAGYMHGSHADVNGLLDNGRDEYYYDSLGIAIQADILCFRGC